MSSLIEALLDLIAFVAAFLPVCETLLEVLVVLDLVVASVVIVVEGAVAADIAAAVVVLEPSAEPIVVEDTVGVAFVVTD